MFAVNVAVLPETHLISRVPSYQPLRSMEAPVAARGLVEYRDVRRDPLVMFPIAACPADVEREGLKQLAVVRPTRPIARAVLGRRAAMTVEAPVDRLAGAA